MGCRCGADEACAGGDSLGNGLTDNGAMLTLFIIAHAPLASALRDCVAHVFPTEAQDILTLDVAADWSQAEVLTQARLRLAASSRSQDVLVFSDLFGATPCNVATQLIDAGHVRLVTGVNLPMLLRAVTYRHEPLSSVVARAVSGGTQGVIAVGSSAPQNQQRRVSNGQDQHHHQQ